MSFGKNLKALRRSNWITQMQLAAASGLAQPTISAIEQKETAPNRPQTVEALEAGLLLCNAPADAVRALFASGVVPAADLPQE